ncbi:hypothetical protein D3C72_2128510 [compost metagenome]
MNGNRSCRKICRNASSEKPPPWPPTVNSRPTSNGVRNMPKIFEAEAEQIAAGTFPPAMEVKAMEDCTVDGSTQRNSTPI